MQRLSVIPELAVRVRVVSVRRLGYRGHFVRVAGEHLRERVAHLDFAVEGARECHKHRVQTAILESPFGDRGFVVILIVVGERGFVVHLLYALRDAPVRAELGCKLERLPSLVDETAQSDFRLGVAVLSSVRELLR